MTLPGFGPARQDSSHYSRQARGNCRSFSAHAWTRPAWEAVSRRRTDRLDSDAGPEVNWSRPKGEAAPIGDPPHTPKITITTWSTSGSAGYLTVLRKLIFLSPKCWTASSRVFRFHWPMSRRVRAHRRPAEAAFTHIRRQRGLMDSLCQGPAKRTIASETVNLLAKPKGSFERPHCQWIIAQRVS